MNKNYLFYKCHLEREMASEGDPGLFAATEVVRAACNANFQRNGFNMRSLPSSPHCYYKYAKLPKDGMYMLWAVKKTNMTTLDILVDTRMFPNLVMIEKNTDWQAETEEVKGAVEKVISDDTNPYNWNFNLEIYSACGTQYLDEFHSALAYMREPNYIYEDYNSNITLNNSNKMEQNSEDFKLKVIQELTKGNVNIGQFIMEMKGNIYNEQPRTEEKTRYSDEQVATALSNIVGKGKAIDSKQKWAGALWYLRWVSNYPAKAQDFCNKIDSLPFDHDLEIKCDYNNIRPFSTLSFMNEDARNLDAVKYSKGDETVFFMLRSVVLALEQELVKTTNLTRLS